MTALVRPSWFGPRRDLSSLRADVRAALVPVNEAGLLSDLDMADAITNPDAAASARQWPLPPAPAELGEQVDLSVRAHVARVRAAHVFASMSLPSAPALAYAARRGLNLGAPRFRDEVRATPLRLDPSVVAVDPELERVARYVNRSPGIAVALRSPIDGRAVDVRLRRFAPPDGQPKILGMVGGLVRTGDMLLGCYGAPHRLKRDRVVVVEGLIDYLTALQVWPDADVLGAADAGSYALVAELAARHVRERGGRLELVVHADATDRGPGAGERAAVAAGRIALAHGLDLDRDLIFVDIGDAEDLNAAHVRGWRP